MGKQVELKGICPAHILPFTDEFRIDIPGLRNHIRALLSVNGIGGVVCNGHAGEVDTLSREERREVTRTVVDEAGGGVPVICGIHAEATWGAIEQANDARADGAGAVLVMPPANFKGATATPEVAYSFFSEIAQAVDIPIIIFQYPEWLGTSYPPQTLVKLTEIESIIAVKEAVWEIGRYEEDIRALRSAPRKISILTANDTLLLPSFVMGTDGAIIGLASLIPQWAVDLFDTVRAGDLAKAHQINDPIFRLTQLIYKPPFMDIHTRIKEGLVVLGQIERSTPRPPRLPLKESEKAAIKAVIEEIGLV